MKFRYDISAWSMTEPQQTISYKTCGVCARSRNGSAYIRVIGMVVDDALALFIMGSLAQFRLCKNNVMIF